VKRTGGLFWQAAFALLVLPGTVAFLIPLLLFEPARAERGFDILALVPLSLGAFLLLWCVKEFYVVGKGTLAPWTPPRELVVTGPFRFSRNPIYIAVVLIILGWALAFHSLPLVVFALATLLVFHLRVVLGEESWLARTHGNRWIEYRERVPRWVGPRRKLE
jgi:protein-S-isoprenylcysteine O-methyltransferase Ste14